MPPSGHCGYTPKERILNNSYPGMSHLRRAPSPRSMDPSHMQQDRLPVNAAKRTQYMHMDRSPDASSVRRLATVRSSPIPHSKDVTMRRVHGTMRPAPQDRPSVHDDGTLPHGGHGWGGGSGSRSTSQHNTPQRRMWLYQQQHRQEFQEHHIDPSSNVAQHPQHVTPRSEAPRRSFIEQPLFAHHDDGRRLNDSAQSFPHHHREESDRGVHAYRKGDSGAQQQRSGSREADESPAYYPAHMDVQRQPLPASQGYGNGSAGGHDQAALQRWAMEYARHAVGYQTARLEQELHLAKQRIVSLEGGEADDSSYRMGVAGGFPAAHRPQPQQSTPIAASMYDAVTMSNIEASVILRTKTARSSHVMEYDRLPCSVTVACPHQRLALDFTATSTSASSRRRRQQQSRDDRRSGGHRSHEHGRGFYSNSNDDDDGDNDDTDGTPFPSDVEDFFLSGITMSPTDGDLLSSRLWNIDLQDVGEVRWVNDKRLIEVRFVPLAVDADASFGGSYHRGATSAHHTQHTQYRVMYLSCTTSTDHSKELFRALQFACGEAQHHKRYATRRPSLSPPRHHAAPAHPTTTLRRDTAPSVAADAQQVPPEAQPRRISATLPPQSRMTPYHTEDSTLATQPPPLNVQKRPSSSIPSEFPPTHATPSDTSIPNTSSNLPSASTSATWRTGTTATSRTTTAVFTAASGIEEESALLAAVDALTRQHDDNNARKHVSVDEAPASVHGQFGEPLRHQAPSSGSRITPSPDAAGATHRRDSSLAALAAVVQPMAAPLVVPHRTPSEIAMVNRTYNDIFGNPDDTQPTSSRSGVVALPLHSSDVSALHAGGRLRSESRQPLSVEDAAFILGIDDGRRRDEPPASEGGRQPQLRVPSQGEPSSPMLTSPRPLQSHDVGGRQPSIGSMSVSPGTPPSRQAAANGGGGLFLSPDGAASPEAQPLRDAPAPAVRVSFAEGTDVAAPRPMPPPPPKAAPSPPVAKAAPPPAAAPPPQPAQAPAPQGPPPPPPPPPTKKAPPAPSAVPPPPPPVAAPPPPAAVPPPVPNTAAPPPQGVPPPPPPPPGKKAPPPLPGKAPPPLPAA